MVSYFLCKTSLLVTNFSICDINCDTVVLAIKHTTFNRTSQLRVVHVGSKCPIFFVLDMVIYPTFKTRALKPDIYAFTPSRTM